jgi:hypothetical protein
MAKDYTAIRVSKEAREAAENAKRDGETWDEYIQRCTENPPEVREYVESSAAGTGTDMSKQLDRIEASTATVEERTGQIQRDLEDLGR